MGNVGIVPRTLYLVTRGEWSAGRFSRFTLKRRHVVTQKLVGSYTQYRRSEEKRPLPLPGMEP